MILICYMPVCLTTSKSGCSRTATGKCCIISNVPHHDKLLNQDKSQNLKCINKSLQLTENQQMPSYQNTGIQLMLFFRSDILLQQISWN